MKAPEWQHEVSPYHAGEQELHERMGRKERQEQTGRYFQRPYMPTQHRDFFAQLPFLIAGAADEQGWPWASILCGHPGFVSTPDDKTLSVGAVPLPSGPMSGLLQANKAVGLLGIELPTRRRNRVNGIVTDRNKSDLTVSVVQSFGNCPKYIHTRGAEFDSAPRSAGSATDVITFDDLDDEATLVLQCADTFFVASYSDRDDDRTNGGADVSHRGGKPGFVKVQGNTLTIPDFAGNLFFNTFGNFLVTPKAGLLFINFETGDIWQLTGRVELLWDMTDEIEQFDGAERAWRFQLHRGVCHRRAVAISWQKGEPSPFALATGDWEPQA